MANSNWAEIHQDILTQIINFIKDPSDHIRISGVCSSWRFVATRYRSILSHPIPGLMVSSLENPKKRKFINFSSPLTSYSDIDDVPCFHQCCGSHMGWLVLIKEDRNSIYLHNPIAKRRRLLPNLGSIDEFSGFVYKAVLSSSPSMDPKCVVLILFEVQGAAFCRLGDESWTILKPLYDDYCYNCSVFSDALFFEGIFYLVDDYGKIYTCNLDRRLFEEFSSQPLEITKIRHKWYLVELKGNIFRVQRKFSSNEGFYYENTIQDDDDYYNNINCGYTFSTREFRVWKMVQDDKKWVRVFGLGEFALFLGCNNSVGISELEVFGIKGNMIYFTDDRQRVKHFGFEWPGKDMGIFDLENSSIEPLCLTQFEWLPDPRAIWVAPLPW